MLQLELNKLTEETNCMNARIEVETACRNSVPTSASKKTSL